MRDALRGVLAALAGLTIAVQLGGCPTDVPPLEFVAGGTGEATILRDEPMVEVLTPVSNLSITGGTQVEVNWRAFASSRISVINVIIDEDGDPDNGNEITAYSGLPLTQTTALVDTTQLTQGTYRIGVVLEEISEIVAYDYARGWITIDQRPQLYFTSPRDNFAYDRAERITPRFNVAWEMNDPDSVNTVDIFLDPDDVANGNEILLYRSNSQDGDNFSFDFPTAAFEAGTYRLLAQVSDGENSFPFYGPGAIVLRSRMAGFKDLRNMDLPDSGVSGAVFEGFNPRDNAGRFLSSIGDIDGDGFDDFLVLSQFGKPRYIINIQRTGVGEAYLWYGRSQRFRGVINLNSTGVLARGDIFGGVPEQHDPIRPSRGITSCTALADWDGDGVRELAFGLPFTDSRVVTLVIGSPGEFKLEVTPMDNDGCFRTGAVVIAAGGSLRPSLNFPGGHVFNLAAFGQVDWSDDQDPECVETFFGPNSPVGFPNRHRPGSVGDNEETAQLGCRIITHDVGDQCGEMVSVYPTNGILISVPNRDPVVNTGIGTSLPGAGVVSLYFGAHVWRAYGDGGETLPHNGPYRYVLDDQRRFLAPPGVFLRGSPSYYMDTDDSPDPCVRVWSDATPVPSQTVRFYGGFAGAAIGNAVTVGDFSADGYHDIALGSPLSNDGAGSCFVVLGRHPFLMVNSELAVEELGLPMNSSDPLGERVFDGIRVMGKRGERLGQSQDAAGDFNNDGIDDVLIGSPLLNNRQGGAAVFYGSREVINLTQTEIPYDELPDRELGVIFVGEGEGDLAGARVAGAGDVDGDGNDDILIAAPNRSVRLDVDMDGTLDIDRTGCGVVYLVYGSPDLRGTLNLADVGTETLPGVVFVGRNSGDHLGAGLGEQGDRSHAAVSAGDVDGDGFGDLLLGSVSASPRDRAQAGETYLIYGLGD